MACSYQCPERLHLLPGHWPKRSWISSDLQEHNYLQIILVTSRTIRSLKLKTKIKVSICGITNTNINRK